MIISFIMIMDSALTFSMYLFLANVSLGYDNSVIMKSHMIFAMKIIIYKDDIFV